MNGKMIHDHIIYDELMEEDEPSPKFDRYSALEPSFRIGKKQGRPFTLQRNEKMQEQSLQKQKKYYEQLKSEGSQSELKTMKKIQQPEQQSLVYQLDFDSYEQSLKESRVSSRYFNNTKKSNSFAYSARKQANMSAQLPSISKVSKIGLNLDSPRQRLLQSTLVRTKVKTKMRRKSNYQLSQVHQGELKRKKKTLNLDDSDDDEKKEIQNLKKKNILIMQKIHELRRIEPILINNYAMIKKQKKQLKKLRKGDSLLYDVEYELKLDRERESLQKSQQKIKQYIRNRSQRFKKKQKILNRQIKKINPLNPDDLQHTEKVDIVRQHYLSKKREQFQLEERILELEKKIIYYQNVISEVDKKLYLGQFEGLTRRKIFLEFDVNKRRQDTSEVIDAITQQNQEIRNQIKGVEAKILETSSQLKMLLQEIKREEVEEERKDGKYNEEWSPKKQEIQEEKKIFFRFFKKRR